MITGKNYIGNRLSGSGPKTYRTFNPLLNIENEFEFVEASIDEINETVLLAVEAYGAYHQKSGTEKAGFLKAIAENIEALDEDLIKMYCSESGLPEGRAKGERGRTVGQLHAFAKLVAEGSWVDATIDTALPTRTPAPRPDLRKMLVPLGPVAIFGASNFPFAFSTAGGDTAAALAAGCPVIVKSHPMHAGTGELVASAIIKAATDTGMPNGVFSNLNSSGIDVGEQLVKHQGVKAVGFTGSLKGGRALFDLAAQRDEPIPVFAEMGSVNPVVVLPQALQNQAKELAATFANSITLGTGQFCTKPGLFFAVKDDGLSIFIDELSKKITEIAPSCMLHPNINQAFEGSKQRTIAYPETVVVAHYKAEVKANFAKQAVVTVNGKAFSENGKLHQEVFGPFAMVVQCRDMNELLDLITNLEGQLTGTIISDGSEIDTYPSVITALQKKVGRIILNGVPTGVEVCPAMQHGGPYPASTDSRFTAVGTKSIKRWVRPFSYQDWPNNLLPDELKRENPLGIHRLVNGLLTSKEN